MIGFQRSVARAIAAVCFLLAALDAADAAGALAVGTCGAYGYGYDFRNLADARVAAMRRCSGKDCKIVGTIRAAASPWRSTPSIHAGRSAGRSIRISAAPRTCRCGVATSSAARTAWCARLPATKRADSGRTPERDPEDCVFALDAYARTWPRGETKRQKPERQIDSIRNCRNDPQKCEPIFRKDDASNKQNYHNPVRLNWILANRYLSGSPILTFLRTPSSKIQS
jgi:hypothetical protein